MSNLIGQPAELLDTPQVLIDLDIVDANVERMVKACRERGIHLRTHFKSLKTLGLARYLGKWGVDSFLCAKLHEAETLVQGGFKDVFIANQVVGPNKLRRLGELAGKAAVAVCVDNPDNVARIGQAAHAAGATIGALVEVDTGMGRCGVEPGEPALALARIIAGNAGLRFLGLQGYDGHLQMVRDPQERRSRCEACLEQLVATRRLIEKAGLPVSVVTGGGTGTWEFVSSCSGMTEIQPGSFVLMDCAYHTVRPEFSCALSLLTTVVSLRPGWYVLDAGSKSISQDFGAPAIKGHPQDKVVKLSEEHARVETPDAGVRVGDLREVFPSHCCATMNLHRNCYGVRKGKIETVWPIEASGRYD